MLNHIQILKKLIELEILIQKKYEAAKAIGVDMDQMFDEFNVKDFIREIVQSPLPDLGEMLFEAKQGTKNINDVLFYIIKDVEKSDF